MTVNRACTAAPQLQCSASGGETTTNTEPEPNCANLLTEDLRFYRGMGPRRRGRFRDTGTRSSSDIACHRGMSPCCSHCRAGDRNSNGLVEARHVDRIAPAQTRTSTPVKNPFLAVFILRSSGYRYRRCLRRSSFSSDVAVESGKVISAQTSNVSATAKRPPSGVDLLALGHCCDRALEQVRIRNAPDDNRRARLKNRPGSADPGCPVD